MVKWNEITAFSRWASIVLFIGVVPMLSFYIGIQFEEVRFQSSQLSSQKITADPNPIQTTHSSNTSYKNLKIGEKINGFTLQSIDRPDIGGVYTFTGTTTVRGIYSSATGDPYSWASFTVDASETRKLPDPTSTIFCFNYPNSNLAEQTLSRLSGEVTITIANFVIDNLPRETCGYYAVFVGLAN